jgi:hypothetical protein
MSRRHQEKGRIPGQWTASRHEVLDSPAWKAMSMGARVLYIALLRELSMSRFNNGKVWLPTRRAAEQLGTRQMNIGRWYRELEHYGFIVMTEGAHLGVEGKGRSAKWRLTDWALGPGCERTCEYLKWDGVIFAPKKTESRSTRRFRVKHMPLHVSEAHAASYLDTPSPPSGLEAGEAGVEVPPWEPEPRRGPREWSEPAMVEMAYTPELRKLYCEAIGAEGRVENAQ